MTYIRINPPQKSDNKVTVNFDPSADVERFFNTNTFFVEYSEPISDISPEVLGIPAIANIVTVAWASSSTLRVPRIDERFYKSLQTVHNSIAGLYPFMTDGPTLETEEIVPVNDNVSEQSKNEGMLFSGGLDSIVTFMRHRDKSPMLFTAHGIDIGLDDTEAWNRTKQEVTEFAAKYDTTAAFMKTNCYTFVNRPMLSAHFGSKITDNSWWSGVQHGLGLLGLCAPLTVKHNLSTLHIGSTYTSEFNRPWGSHPKIDDNVAWRTTTANHDGFAFSRQEKLNQLAESLNPDEAFTIRACYESETGGNCGQCEKCGRTILGLTNAGLDPERFGFPADISTFEHIRTQIESGEWQFGYDENYFWEDLREHSPDPESVEDPAMAEFYSWLQSATFKNYHHSESQSVKTRVLWTIARNSPNAVFRRLYPVYSKLTS